MASLCYHEDLSVSSDFCLAESDDEILTAHVKLLTTGCHNFQLFQNCKDRGKLLCHGGPASVLTIQYPRGLT